MATTTLPELSVESPQSAASVTLDDHRPSTLIVDLADVTRANIATVGGKGANLGEMLRAELPVPPGFVVTVAAYEHMRETGELGERLDALLRTANPDDPTALQQLSAQLCELLRVVPLPSELEAAISRP